MPGESAGLLTRRGFQAVMVAVLLMLAIPFGLWGLAHAREDRQRAHQRAFDAAIDLTRLQAQRHDAVLDEAIGVATLLAALPEVQAGGEPCQQRLAGILDELPRYNNLFAADAEGRSICSGRGDAGISIADRPYFWQAMETGRPAVGNYTISRATGMAVVAVAVPFDGGAGVAGASVRLDTLHQELQEAALSGATVSLLDQEGTIMARSQDARFVGEPSALWPQVAGRDETTFVASGNDGVRRLWAAQAVADDAGRPVAYVLAGHEAEEVHGPIAERFRREVALFLAVSAGAVLTTWAVSHRTLGRHERLLTRSEARFRTFFQLSPDPILITDAAGWLREVNGALEQVLGYTRQELLDRPFLDFVHPEDRQRTGEVYRSMPVGGGPEAQFENRYLRKDGSTVWFDWHWCPGPDGLTYAVARDITRRKDAEAALRKEHDLLEEAQSIAHIGSWEWDAATDRTTMSRQGWAIWRVREGTVLSSGGLLALVQEEDRARFEAEAASAADEGRDFDVSVRIRTPLGPRWVRHRGRVAARSEDGKPLRFVGTVEDITDKRRAEEERVQLAVTRAEADRLAQLNDFKTRFIGMVSHDLNNVLSPMVLHLKMVEDASRGRAELKEPVDGLRRNVRRLSRFLADLLDATRLQAGELKLGLEDVDLAAIVRASLHDAEREAQERGVALRAELPPAARLRADPHRLDQVVTNLLSNALKFTPRGGSVQVLVAQEGEDIRLEVADSGPGIAVEDLAKLFRPFSRVGDGAQQRHTGTGLGLFICKGIAEAHGGRIHAASAGRGHGARFTVVLPRAGPPRPADSIA